MLADVTQNGSIGIVGVGSYVPERVLTNDDLSKLVETSDEWIVERTGIKERHIAEPRQAASDLALHLDHPLLAHRLEGAHEVGLLVGAHHHLRDAGAVAEVEEEDAAEVAPPRHPAGELHPVPDVLDAQRARSCPLHPVLSTGSMRVAR